MAKTRNYQPFGDADVRSAFDAYQATLRAHLLDLRQLIFDTARATADIGPLIETLKWGQPAYMPRKPKVGTTIRIDALQPPERGYAIFFHCRTTLVPTLRDLYADELVFDGNRAIFLRQGTKLPRAALEHGIALALTYHLRRGRT